MGWQRFVLQHQTPEQATETVSLTIDGRSYEIHLSPANAKHLRQGLAGYIRRVREMTLPVGDDRPLFGPCDVRALRAWARNHPDEEIRAKGSASVGRLPWTVQLAYAAQVLHHPAAVAIMETYNCAVKEME